MSVPTQEFYLDIKPGKHPFHVKATQYDKGVNGWNFTANLRLDGEDFTVPDGSTAKVQGTNQKDGVEFELSATVDSSSVSFTLTEDATQSNGSYYCKIAITTGNSEFSTAAFVLDLDKAGNNANNAYPPSGGTAKSNGEVVQIRYGNATIRERGIRSDVTDQEAATAFVAYMNNRAAQYGMTNTVFYTPSGLPDDAPGNTSPISDNPRGNNLTTSADLFKLGMAAATEPRVLEQMAKKSETILYLGQRTLYRDLVSIVLTESNQKSVKGMEKTGDTWGEALYPTQTILCGKGGSLTGSYGGQDTHGIKNMAAVVDVGGVPYLVSVVGCWYDDALWRIVGDVADCAAVKESGSTPTIDSTHHAMLYNAATRAEYPVAVAAFRIPSNGILYRSMQTAELIALNAFVVNPNAQKYAASTTKMMTALLVTELCDGDEIVRIGDWAASVDGTRFTADKSLTVRDLLAAMMLVSDNQAAEALAVYAGRKLVKSGVT